MDDVCIPVCVFESESEKAWRSDKGDKVDRRRTKSCVMQKYMSEPSRQQARLVAKT
jgi:hypothetical protein